MLIIGWIIGVVSYSLGGLIHLLLAISIIAILLDLIRGRRPI
ncbi:MAG: lmo0937 family membrane protein [Bacteroidota bacterium]